MTDDGEQVQPWLLTGLRRLRRWQQGHTSGSDSRHVTLGLMGDGRWLVEHTDIRVGSYAYRSRERAEQEAAKHMRDGDWHEVPAVLDANGQAEGWVRRGNTWMRDEGSGAG
ncbi:hypothetical protein MED01_002409 [Micromonospora sp. MED01]|uniref:hypothetical protein n=1 Tax=Micromonospora alfalfae TaxID=2911212 RepID=UPI001EE8577B|nr:hypothetical protein [Micromonospora alfalfae]MCG5464244.1 hypothetical protein [Micromonospora alfalfae]